MSGSNKPRKPNRTSRDPAIKQLEETLEIATSTNFSGSHRGPEEGAAVRGLARGLHAPVYVTGKRHLPEDCGNHTEPSVEGADGTREDYVVPRPHNALRSFGRYALLCMCVCGGGGGEGGRDGRMGVYECL